MTKEVDSRSRLTLKERGCFLRFMLRHAPVSAVSLGALVASSTVFSYVFTPLAVAAPGTIAANNLAVWLLTTPLTFFPFAPIPASGWTFVCVLVLVFHFRHLERLWGSSKFLSYLLIASVAGKVLAALASTSPAIRVANSVPVIIPIAALTFRYYVDIPSLGNSSLFGLKRIVVNEKYFLVAAAVKCALFPYVASKLFVGLAKDAPVSPVGLAVRAALACAGIFIGVLSTRRGPFTTFWSLLTEKVTRPFVVSCLQPLTTAICGSASTLRHFDPPAEQQPVQQQRHVVGNLAGNDDIPHEVWDQIMREQAQLNTPNNNGAAANNSHQRVDTAKMQTLRDLGFGASDDEIIEALQLTSGDVDMAAHLLLERH